MEKETISVRVKPDTFRWIKERAQEQGISCNAVINIILTKEQRGDEQQNYKGTR